MVFVLCVLAFALALAGLIVSLIQSAGPCICGCEHKAHAEVMTPQGRLPHGGYCKTCSCRVYIAK